MAEKIAYLTIDDAPSDDFRRKVDLLSGKGIPALFFCEGRRLSGFEDDVIHAIRQGFVVGNHSWSHRDFSELTEREIREEIGKTDEAIDGLYTRAGVGRAFRVFRFPFLKNGGANAAFTQEILKGLGYRQPRFENIAYEWYREKRLHADRSVFCTYDSMDWTVADGSHVFGIRDLRDLLDRMDEDVPEGMRGLNSTISNEIIMMHDDPRIREMFEPMIARLVGKGLIFRLPSW